MFLTGAEAEESLRKIKEYYAKKIICYHGGIICNDLE